MFYELTQGQRLALNTGTSGEALFLQKLTQCYAVWAGVVKRVPWSIQSPSGPRTGQFLLSDYVSPRFADTNGFWMGLPQAVRDLRESNPQTRV